MLKGFLSLLRQLLRSRLFGPLLGPLLLAIILGVGGLIFARFGLGATALGIGGAVVAVFLLAFFLERPGSPLESFIKRRALSKYLQERKKALFEALAPGSTELFMEDIIGGDGLFIDPPWTIDHATLSSNLVEYLIQSVAKKRRVLLLGQTGQGKSTVLQRVFVVLADSFLQARGDQAPFPIYLPLSEFPYPNGDPRELLWAYLKPKFPLSKEDFVTLLQNERTIFLFDGFDNIKGELSQAAIFERAAHEVFSYAAIISSRKSFYELYLKETPIQGWFHRKVALQPLVFSDAITSYITHYWKKKRNRGSRFITPPTRLIKTIQESPELQDLAQRPLMLTMMLDVFSDPEKVQATPRSLAELYDEYTEKWLKHEATKSDSILNWFQKAALIQEIAWSLYSQRIRSGGAYGMYGAMRIAQPQLATLLQEVNKYPYDADKVLYDLCLRTFLVADDGDHFYFIHRSFQEYYVARYIFECMQRKGDQLRHIEQALQEFIPVQVARFLREMLRAGSLYKHEKKAIAENLINVYKQQSGDKSSSVIIRQHASHYLGYLGTPQAISFLEHSYPQEPNKWVQRGMMVGLALAGEKTEIVERYIEILNSDAEAASINLGYHLIYYGDQPLEEGYTDQGGKCEGTLFAIIRHLTTESYKNAWVLDLITLRMLVETRGVEIFASDVKHLPTLREFLGKDHQDQGPVFYREKGRLRAAIEV